MYNIPDNYDKYEMYEQEQERRRRIDRKNAIEEEFDTDDDLPFYDDQEDDAWVYTKVYS